MPAGTDDAKEPLPDGAFRAIVERTDSPFVVIDRSGTIVFVSPSITWIMRWRPDQLEGRNIAEFLDPAALELALEALGELEGDGAVDAALPIVFPVLLPEGGHRYVAVAALALADQGDGDLVALRLRSWEAERHMADFVRSMVAGEALSEDLAHLLRSISASLEGVGATVHHGFDGECFRAVVGSWPGATDLPLDAAPWSAALAGDDVAEVAAGHPALAGIGAVTGWSLAVHTRAGLPPAVLTVWRRRVTPVFVGHRQAFARARDLVELAIVRTAEQDRLVHLARHDPLTGIANRRTFGDLLAAAIARGERDLAVGFCDLDDFKAVNDQRGHRIGDDVLVTVVDRLRQGLRAGDEIARVGGDEFTVLWRGIADADAALAAAARLVAVGDLPVPDAQGGLVVGLSVGVALVEPGATAESVLAAADAAMYDAKKAGGRRVTLRPTAG